MAIRTSDTIWEDSVDPTVNDDSSAGLQVGDQWRNTATGEVFEVTDVSVGAAQWYSITDIFASLNPRVNYVLVKSLSDFPAPVSGVITLADNTTYEINGTVALGTNRIVAGASCLIMGLDKSDSILVYSGTADAITVTNDDISLRNFTIVAGGVGARCINMSGDGTNRVEIAECIFANSDELGVISGGFTTIVFRNNLITNNNDGLSISGNNDDLFITDNVLEDFNLTPTFVSIATGNYHTIFISRNMFETVASQTALSIGDITFTAGGLMDSNSFEGVGTALSGITANSDGWNIPSMSNTGIAGLFQTSRTIILGTYGGTTSNVWLSVTQQVLTKATADDYEPNATTIRAALTVGVSHDDNGGSIAYRLYNFTDSHGVGFSDGTDTDTDKADVDTIAWQSGNTIRYTFNGTPDLSNLNIGDFMTVESATNASNNGTFEITAVNDGSDWIEVTNPNRTDATDDEATDSPALAWGGSYGFIDITTGGVYEVHTTPEFQLELGKEYRVQVAKKSGTGSANVLVNAGDLNKKIF